MFWEGGIAMSHFSTIKTSLVEEEFLLKGLQDLGHQPQVGNVEVRGYRGNRTAVRVKIATSSPSYDIGFRKVGQTFEMVADWYGIRGISQKDFLQRLTQRYAYHATRAKLEEQGFQLVGEVVQPDGQIHLVLRRLA
jgi:hypothetical protein